MVSATLDRVSVNDKVLDKIEVESGRRLTSYEDVFSSGTVTADETKKTCCHHWIIDRPNGPLSHGYCKNCGEERDFSNLPIVAVKREVVDYSFRRTYHNDRPLVPVA